MPLETTIVVSPECFPDDPHKIVIGGDFCFQIGGTISQAEEGERSPNDTLVTDNMHPCTSGAYPAFCKTGGPNNTYDAAMYEPDLLDPRQNAYIQMMSSLTQPVPGRNTGWIAWQSPDDPLDRFMIQTVQINSHYVGFIYIPGSATQVAVYDPGANGIELQSPLRIWMNGSQVIFQHRRSFNWTTIYSTGLGSSRYRAQWGTASLDNPMVYPRIFKGAWSAPVACADIIATAPDGGVLTGDGCQRCFSAPLVPDIYRVNFDYPGEDTIECEVQAEELTVYSPDCTTEETFVLVGAQVTIDHNGGPTAELIVSAGVALDAYTWLTPTIPGIYQFKVIAFGNETEWCEVRVENKLEVEGVVEGVFDNVAPGECIEFQINCDDTEAEFICLDYPQNLVGNKFCANGGNEECFGAFTARMIVRACSQEVQFEIRVMPIFPVPAFCGPKPKYFPRPRRKHSTSKQTTKGLCAEYFLHSRNPMLTWKGLEYVGLLYDAEREKCPDGLMIPCGDNPQVPTVGGCPKYLMTAKRLDDFVSFVKDEFGGFAFYCIRSKRMYKNVHFEQISDPTHDNARTGNKRKYDLVYYPCCEDEPNHPGSCSVNPYF